MTSFYSVRLLSLSLLAACCVMLSGCTDSPSKKYVTAAELYRPEPERKVSESDVVGLPVYPGAVPKPGLPGGLKMDGNLASVTLITNDGVEKVAAFYGKELRQPNQDLKKKGILSGYNQNGQETVITLTRKDNHTEITITVLDRKEELIKA